MTRVLYLAYVLLVSVGLFGGWLLYNNQMLSLAGFVLNGRTVLAGALAINGLILVFTSSEKNPRQITGLISVIAGVLLAFPRPTH